MGTVDKCQAFEEVPWESLYTKDHRRGQEISLLRAWPDLSSKPSKDCKLSTKNSFYSPKRERQEPWRSALKRDLPGERKDQEPS